MYSRYVYEIVGGILIFVSSLVGEQMPPRLKKLSYAIFALFAVGYVLIGVYLDKDSARQQAKLEQKITDLQKSSELAESARRSDRDVFFAEFGSLNSQMLNLRANVQTEGLRKQLDETQRSLAHTEQELRSREIALEFAINGHANPSELHVKETPLGGNKVAILSLALTNPSAFDTGNGVAEVRLISCGTAPDCHIAGIDPWPYVSPGTALGRDFVSVPKHGMVNLGRAEIFASSGDLMEAQIAIRFHCVLCIPDEWHSVTIKISP